jgi:hypothetical protein
VAHAGFEITISGFKGPKELASFTVPAPLYSTLALTNSNHVPYVQRIYKLLSGSRTGGDIPVDRIGQCVAHATGKQYKGGK